MWYWHGFVLVLSLAIATIGIVGIQLGVYREARDTSRTHYGPSDVWIGLTFIVLSVVLFAGTFLK